MPDSAIWKWAHPGLAKVKREATLARMKIGLPALVLLAGIGLGYLLAPRDGVDAGAPPRSGSGPGGSGNLVDGGSVPDGAPDVDGDGAGAVEDRAAVVSLEAWLEELEGLSRFERTSRVYARLRHLGLGGVKELYAALEASGKHGQLVRLVFQRWAELDPEGMFAHMREQLEENGRRISGELFSAWAEEDPEAARAAAKELTGHERYRAMSSIVRAVAQTDPQRAIHLAREEMGHRRHGGWTYRQIFSTWARNDPAAARAAALELPPGRERASALQGALGRLMAEDPEAALEWLDAQPVDSDLHQTRKSLLRNMFSRDFDRAKAYVEGLPTRYERREILESVYFQHQLRDKDFSEIEGVFDWLGEMTSGQAYDRQVRNLVGVMLDRDPERVERFIVNMRPGSARSNALGAYAGRLAGEDPAAALAFVRGLEYADERSWALNSIAGRLARGDVEANSVLIAESGDPEVLKRTASRLAGHWAEFDREAALRWAEGLEGDTGARENAVGAVMRNWMQAEPEAAFRYMESSMEPEEYGTFLQQGFSGWAREDPREAVNWLERIPESDGNKRPGIYGNVARSYVRHDPMAASEWIAGLEEGPERDHSVRALVQSISDSDPEAALIWAGTVKESGMRARTLSRSVQNWAKEDAESAARAVRDARIAVEEKESLLEMIGKTGGR